MLLSEFKGHHGPVQILKNALIRNRVAHAYLLIGPGKSGKNAVASSFARAYLCGQGRTLGDSCGECPSCRTFLQRNHPDVKIIEPAGASIKIDQIRELSQQVYIKAYAGLGKVYLLTKVETMTTEAANSFLKILEEPPEGVIFLLVSTKPYDILPTISSRCQILQFSSLAPASGSQQPNEVDARKQELLDITDKLFDNQELTVFQVAEEFEKNGKNKQELSEMLDVLAVWYRDLLLWKTTGQAELLINGDLLESLQAVSPKVSTDRLISNIEVIEQTKEYLQANVNTRLAIENMLIELLGGYK